MNTDAQTLDHRVEHGRPLREFSHADVELAPGLHRTQLEQLLSVLLGMDEDGLLWSYRTYAGLPTPGRPLGGVYDGWGDAEHFGAFVSALARYHAISPNEAVRAKVERLVSGYAETVEPSGKIFPRRAGASTTAINTAKYHRIVRGLIDAHRFTNDPIALDALSRTTEAVIPLLPDAPGGNAAAGWTLTLPETEFRAWQYTGDPRHLEIAKRNLYESFFDELVAGDDCLGGRNAQAHAEAIAGAARGYLVLGDERYLQAARNGFALIEAQSYATGAWGPNECFLPSPQPFGDEPPLPGWMPEIRTLGDSLTRTHRHFQLLSAHTHFTLASNLLRITRDPAYGDSMERLTYNTVLGALPLYETGMAYYYCDYHEDARKVFFDNFGFDGRQGPEWPLEAAVLPIVATDYGITSYFRDEAGVYVSGYLPSTLRWRQGESEVSLTQTGTYPLGDVIEMALETSRPVRFDVRLRIPAWAVRPSVTVNGEPVGSRVEPGSFLAVSREWRTGDRLELVFPRALVLQPVDSESPDLVALVSGPLVLFAMTTETPTFTRDQLLSATQVDPAGDEWRVQVGDRSIRFVPFWAISYQRYSTYLTVTD